MPETVNDEIAPGSQHEHPAKKIPCWICGGDLVLNFPTVSRAAVTIRAYCTKCRKGRTIWLALDQQETEK